MAEQRPLDAYVCYGAEDAGWVRVLAGGLFQANLEVFLDVWQPGGDDVLALRLKAGSAHCRCTILVLGPAAMSTPWVRQRYEDLMAPGLMVGAPTHGTAAPRYIPVLHGDIEPPPFAAHGIDFRGADATTYSDRVQDLVRAIGAPTGRPHRPLAGATAGPPRSARLRIGPDRVTCTLSNAESGAESGADVTLDGHRFGSLLSNRQRHDAEALRVLGTALGATFTPDPVGRTLEDAAAQAYALGTPLNIGVTAAGDLADLPWETLILPGHSEPLALHEAIRVYRAHDGDTTTGTTGTVPGPAIPAPLRILVAIANPDSGPPMDYERELAAVMDAVEPARKHHGAHVRILNQGTLSAVREALSEEPFHVLHLSCHARPGALLLEDAHGRPQEVTPESLRAAIPTPGVPLVILSGSWTTHSAPGAEALSALASALLPAGVHQVLAMTAPVTDRYATALCADLYRELSLAAEPEVLAALTHARRSGEAHRRQVAAAGRPAPAEWATPTLHLRAAPAPLYDPADGTVGWSAGRLDPDDQHRWAGEFVGRRPDLLRLLSVLRQTDSPGVLLHGIDGAGKSALAAEAVRLLGTDAAVVVSTMGTVTADDLRTAIGRARSGRPVLLLTEARLVRSSGDSGGWMLADQGVAELLAGWVRSANRGRLVLTSRHPFELPHGAHRRLWLHHVGPLSWPEARKLIWRLPALNTLSLTDQHKSYLDVGGHPRCLELLDALLRRPGISFPNTRKRLERLLLDRKIDRPELWMAHHGRHGLDTSLAEAVTLAVHRGLLADLVATLDEPARAMLVRIAAARRPVPQTQLWPPFEPPGTDPQPGCEVARALAALAHLRLLTCVRDHTGVSYVVDPATTDLLTAPA